MNTATHLSEHLQKQHLKSWQQQLPWLAEALNHAKQQLSDLNHYRGEAYRYSRIPRLFESTWENNAEILELNELTLPFNAENYRFVFIDGLFAQSLSKLPQTTSWQYQSWEKAMNACPAWLKSRLAALPGPLSEQMNLLLCQDGIVLEILANTNVDKPIDFIHYYVNQTPSMSHTRHAIHLHAHAKATINEYHIGQDAAKSLASTSTLFELANHAKLTYRLLRHGQEQFHHLQHIAAFLASHSELLSFQTDVNANLLRSDVCVKLTGDHANLNAKALFIAKNREQIEHQWLIEHHGKHTTSQTLIKGIADDEGQGICRGRIHVFPTAVKTDASLYSKNLLLSPKAQIDTLPELTILQDDVACKHGATIGQLDEEALFYLQSRGMSLIDAKQLLTRAFIQSELNDLPSDLKDYLSQKILYQSADLDFTRGLATC